MSGTGSPEVCNSEGNGAKSKGASDVAEGAPSLQGLGEGTEMQSILWVAGPGAEVHEPMAGYLVRQVERAGLRKVGKV